MFDLSNTCFSYKQMEHLKSLGVNTDFTSVIVNTCDIVYVHNDNEFYEFGDVVDYYTELGTDPTFIESFTVADALYTLPAMIDETYQLTIKKCKDGFSVSYDNCFEIGLNTTKYSSRGNLVDALFEMFKIVYPIG